MSSASTTPADDAARGERPGAAPRWEHFPHDADVGIRGYGRTLAEAFEQTALALTAAVTDPAGVAHTVAVPIECAAPDDEVLLVDWLNAIVYEMATRHVCFGRYDVSVADGRLTARAYGEPLDLRRHEPAVEVKGATYTALRVARAPDGCWLAQCVIDV
jgi:tRNA nucleotidyltransferase (CCA-adding enzyme)